MAIVGRCSICNLGVESFEGLNSCPNCGTTFTPLASGDDVSLMINWGTLHTLVVWAERWAGQYAKTEPDMLRLVYNATIQMEQQYPGYAPLSLATEIRLLRERFGRFETIYQNREDQDRQASEAVTEVEKILRNGD